MTRRTYSLDAHVRSLHVIFKEGVQCVVDLGAGEVNCLQSSIGGASASTKGVCAFHTSSAWEARFQGCPQDSILGVLPFLKPCHVSPLPHLSLAEHGVSRAGPRTTTPCPFCIAV